MWCEADYFIKHYFTLLVVLFNMTLISLYYCNAIYTLHLLQLQLHLHSYNFLIPLVLLLNPLISNNTSVSPVIAANVTSPFTSASILIQVL